MTELCGGCMYLMVAAEVTEASKTSRDVAQATY